MLVDLAKRICIDDEGFVLPVTNWFDDEGDECEPEDAVACVAGYGDFWLSINLALMKDRTETLH